MSGVYDYDGMDQMGLYAHWKRIMSDVEQFVQLGDVFVHRTSHTIGYVIVHIDEHMLWYMPKDGACIATRSQEFRARESWFRWGYVLL